MIMATGVEARQKFDLTVQKTCFFVIEIVIIYVTKI